MTSLAAERAERARWKLLPQYAGLDVFDRLVETEFTAPEQLPWRRRVRLPPWSNLP